MYMYIFSAPALSRQPCEVYTLQHLYLYVFPSAQFWSKVTLLTGVRGNRSWSLNVSLCSGANMTGSACHGPGCCGTTIPIKFYGRRSWNSERDVRIAVNIGEGNTLVKGLYGHQVAIRRSACPRSSYCDLSLGKFLNSLSCRINNYLRTARIKLGRPRV